MLVVPNDAKIVLPEKGWRTIRCEDNPSWDYTRQAELLDRFATSDYPNLVVFSKKKKPHIISGSKEELEKRRAIDVENERYDDYWYEPDKEGNLWCSGISMKEDMDSCEAWQESHSDECKHCSSPCRLRL